MSESASSESSVTCMAVLGGKRGDPGGTLHYCGLPEDAHWPMSGGVSENTPDHAFVPPSVTRCETCAGEGIVQAPRDTVVPDADGNPSLRLVDDYDTCPDCGGYGQPAPAPSTRPLKRGFGERVDFATGESSPSERPTAPSTDLASRRIVDNMTEADGPFVIDAPPVPSSIEGDTVSEARVDALEFADAIEYTARQLRRGEIDRINAIQSIARMGRAVRTYR